MPRDRIYIVGFMGSGKSTAGKKLSAVLGWEFTDLDRKIEDTAKLPIPQIFSGLGEDEFRKIETTSLRETALYTRTVISTGGGAPCHSGNMDFMLTTGITVYLKLTPEQLRSRLVGSKTERPLIKGLGEEELLAFIKDRLALRESYYNRADIVMEGCELDLPRLESLIRERISK